MAKRARRKPKAKRAKLGRPNHEPTPQQRHDCQLYAGVGVPHHDIAVLLGMSIHTLLKYYDLELKTGKAKANAAVGGTLYKMASSGKVPAATIFWSKAQMGWREVNRLELGGLDGGPVAAATVVAQATDEDSMRTYLAMINKPKGE